MSEVGRGNRRAVVHVSSAHPWTDNRVHYRECASLAAAGYQVTLIATESSVSGALGAVEVLTIPRRGRLRRVLLSTAQALILAVKTKPEIVHLHDPELVWAIPLLRLLGKVVVYDAHEDLPNQVKSKLYLSPVARPLASLSARLLVMIAGVSTHIIAATDTIAKRFPAGKTSIVRNFPPLRDEESVAESIDMRPMRAVYIGAIDENRGAMVMVRAADHFPPGWKLHLAGPMSESLQSRLEQEPGWSSTVYHGSLSPESARDLLLSSRVGLVVLSGTPAYVESLPTKMFEYFAASLPVIASDFQSWRLLTPDRDCCVFVDETSPIAVADAVRRFAEDPELTSRYSVEARRLAETDLNWSHEARVLLRAYEGLP